MVDQLEPVVRPSFGTPDSDFEAAEAQSEFLDCGFLSPITHSPCNLYSPSRRLVESGGAVEKTGGAYPAINVRRKPKEARRHNGEATRAEARAPRLKPQQKITIPSSTRTAHGQGVQGPCAQVLKSSLAPKAAPVKGP